MTSLGKKILFLKTFLVASVRLCLVVYFYFHAKVFFEFFWWMVWVITDGFHVHHFYWYIGIEHVVIALGIFLVVEYGVKTSSMCIYGKVLKTYLKELILYILNQLCSGNRLFV